MNTQDFTAIIIADQTPEEIFNAINNVRGWWSEEIEGSTTKLNDVFDYHFEDIHRCRLKIVEFVPNAKVVWLVMENYFKPGIFEDGLVASRIKDRLPNDKAEWTDTKISFEIT